MVKQLFTIAVTFEVKGNLIQGHCIIINIMYVSYIIYGDINSGRPIGE